MNVCPDCDGTRHRWSKKSKAFVPCSCLRRRRNLARYHRAGVPVRFENETWKTASRTYRINGIRKLITAAKVLSSGNLPRDWFVIHGTPARARSLVACLMLRAACDGRLESRLTDIPTLIDSEFQPGRGSEIYEVEFLIVETGSEPANKWNKHVLQKALGWRWSHAKPTVVVCDGDPARMGMLYKSTRIEESISRCKRVRVEPKEKS